MIEIRTEENGTPAGKAQMHSSTGWTTVEAGMPALHGTLPLYITYEGEGYIDFDSFTVNKKDN